MEIIINTAQTPLDLNTEEFTRSAKVEIFDPAKVMINLTIDITAGTNEDTTIERMALSANRLLAITLLAKVYPSAKSTSSNDHAKEENPFINIPLIKMKSIIMPMKRS